MSRAQWWAALLVVGLGAASILGCSGKKQVPFGLKDAAVSADEEPSSAIDESPELPVGKSFEPNQVEVPMGESALVLESGYALGALSLDLDGAEPLDAIVASADATEVKVQAAFERGLGVNTAAIDSFLVPDHCKEPSAQLRQLSSSLLSVRVDHVCEDGPRTNVWILTIEAQPRVRERVTVLPPNARSTAPIALQIGAEDRDQDGYEDVVVELQVGEVSVPLVWLNRPGGFARDASQPEASYRVLADDAWAFLDSDRAGSEKRARGVLDAFTALCRESGSSRIGLTGTQGIQCRQSPATARAAAVAMAAAVRRGAFIEALERQRWWGVSATQPTAEERALVQSAWQEAKASARASWRVLGRESATASLYFTDNDTLVIDGFSPTSVSISTGSTTKLSKGALLPPVRSPDGRFALRSVRATCAGFEAEVGPVGAKRAHRVSIERRPATTPCRTPIDRPALLSEWGVLGWAPQGLVAGAGDLLRVIPLDELGKTAGRPIELRVGSPLPAPIRGARITPDGSRYVIPHGEGVVVRDWRKGGSGLWLRPSDWSAVPGALRALALSPDGKRIALQKGNEIRLLTW